MRNGCCIEFLHDFNVLISSLNGVMSDIVDTAWEVTDIVPSFKVCIDKCYNYDEKYRVLSISHPIFDLNRKENTGVIGLMVAIIL